VSVAQHRSFRRAAAELGVTPSAISQAVRGHASTPECRRDPRAIYSSSQTSSKRAPLTDTAANTLADARTGKNIRL
jgi:predicted transcriptional regulator